MPLRRQLFARLTASSTVCALMISTAALGSPRLAETDPLSKLAVWQGHWNEVVVTMATPYSRASSVPLHVACSWTPDHGYMLCEYERDRGDPAKLEASDHLSIFTYDSHAKSLKHLGVSKNYETLEEMVRIDGHVWHYDYQLPSSGGKLLNLRDSYEFINRNKRMTRTEVSSDGGRHWILISESVANRVRRP
jgi:hypothetical protein